MKKKCSIGFLCDPPYFLCMWGDRKEQHQGLLCVPHMNAVGAWQLPERKNFDDEFRKRMAKAVIQERHAEE